MDRLLLATDPGSAHQDWIELERPRIGGREAEEPSGLRQHDGAWRLCIAPALIQAGARGPASIPGAAPAPFLSVAGILAGNEDGAGLDVNTGTPGHRYRHGLGQAWLPTPLAAAARGYTRACPEGLFSGVVAMGAAKSASSGAGDERALVAACGTLTLRGRQEDIIPHTLPLLLHAASRTGGYMSHEAGAAATSEARITAPSALQLDAAHEAEAGTAAAKLVGLRYRPDAA